MNEQIYKIARQADALARERVPDLREIVLYDRIRDELFAELIVQECINVIAESREVRQTAYYYRNRLAEHFGVKE